MSHFLFLLSCFLPFVSFAMNEPGESVTWENFLPKYLSKSPQIQQFKLERLPQNWEALQDEKLKVWQMTLQTGREKTAGQSLSQSSGLSREVDVAGVELSKKWLTGTETSLQMNWQSLRGGELHESIGPRTFYQGELEVTQSLWKNAFGTADRIDRNQAERSDEIRKDKDQQELSQLLIEASEAFWNYVLAENRLRQVKEVQKRYQQLELYVKEKARASYTGPGELAQVQAEVVARELELLQAEASLNSAEEAFQKLLPEGRLSNPPYQNQIPRLEEADLQNFNAFTLRQQIDLDRKALSSERLKIQKLKHEDRSELDFVGKVGRTGSEALGSQAQSQFSQGENPYWFAGFEWTYKFDSKIQSESLKLSEQRMKAIEIRLKQREDELLKIEELRKQELRNLAKSLELMSQQIQLREKVVGELMAAYRKGRLDMTGLIDSLNRVENLKSQMVQYRSQFEILKLKLSLESIVQKNKF